jgi:hypothetical protein
MRFRQNLKVLRSASGRERRCRIDDARRLVQGYVDRYNNVRLNGATACITPKDMLAGLQQEIGRRTGPKSTPIKGY